MEHFPLYCSAQSVERDDYVLSNRHPMKLSSSPGNENRSDEADMADDELPDDDFEEGKITLK